ncbi:MAG TPA: hypothetical protein VHF06_14290 [Pseudonocardiaceae bacterium]|jgi:hypothetical protein|nr:hypothetical protein [Pseudonocardiaceae bacterium]
MAGQVESQPVAVARRFLRRRLVLDLVCLVVGAALLAAGVAGVFTVPFLVAGALFLLVGGYRLVVARGTGQALRTADRPMVAAKFARRRVALRDNGESWELRVRGQAGKLPGDTDAAVRVFGGPGDRSVLVIVDPATGAVVFGRIP